MSACPALLCCFCDYVFLASRTSSGLLASEHADEDGTPLSRGGRSASIAFELAPNVRRQGQGGFAEGYLGGLVTGQDHRGIGGAGGSSSAVGGNAREWSHGGHGNGGGSDPRVALRVPVPASASAHPLSGGRVGISQVGRLPGHNAPSLDLVTAISQVMQWQDDCTLTLQTLESTVAALTTSVTSVAQNMRLLSAEVEHLRKRVSRVPVAGIDDNEVEAAAQPGTMGATATEDGGGSQPSGVNLKGRGAPAKVIRKKQQSLTNLTKPSLNALGILP